MVLYTQENQGEMGMKVTIETTTIGTVVQHAKNSRDVVEILKRLALDGVKCVRWVVEDVD